MTYASFQKYISHPLEGIIAHAVYYLMGLIPIDITSAIGGRIARAIGPRLRVNQIAKDNLEKAFPDKTEEEIAIIIKDMWENLGRTAFEFSHVSKINIYDDPERFEIVGGENIDLLRNDGKCGILFSAHMANWEFCSLAVAQRPPSMPVHMIQRVPDNPWMRKLFNKRKPTPECTLIPKGSKGARQALGVLKSKQHLAMLVDQKMNDGVSVPFFGREAMTAPAIAQFALKYDCPLFPVRAERLEGAKFRLTFFPPMELKKTDDIHNDIITILSDVNALLESWITERPSQWLWLHRRWPKD